MFQLHQIHIFVPTLKLISIRNYLDHSSKVNCVREKKIRRKKERNKSSLGGGTVAKALDLQA